MKKHIISEMRSAGMSAADAEVGFDNALTAMQVLIERGERVRLPGIGTLARVTRAETRRRNPQTGESITVGVRDVVSLRNARKF